jgi:hypothetical protein
MLLLAHGLGTARPASAACNHRVISRSDRLADLDQLDALIVGDGSATLAEDPDPDPLSPIGSKRPVPCSRPGCSSRVPMPAPSAFPDSERSDQWAVLNAVLHLPLISPPCRTIHEPAAPPAGEEPSIFHPPPA